MKDTQLYLTNKRDFCVFFKESLLLLLVAAILIPVTIVDTEALSEFETCAVARWRHMDWGSFTYEEECSSGSFVESRYTNTEFVNADADGEAHAIAEGTYGNHKSYVYADALDNVNLSDAWIDTHWSEILTIERISQLYGLSGTALICWAVTGTIGDITGEGGLFIGLTSYWNDATPLDYWEAFDGLSSSSFSLVECGEHNYNISEFNIFDEYFYLNAYSTAVASVGEESVGEAKADFMSTVKLDSINLPEGHYLAYAESGTEYPVCSKSFPDVPTGYWAETHIRRIACKDITSGYGDGTYKPSNTVNRAQMAAYIVRTVDDTEPPDCISNPFPDVPSNNWACKYIKRANELGVVNGYGDGNYKPTNIVNRGQMAAFIVKGMIADGQLGGEPSVCASDPFPDVPSGHIFCKYIQELVNQEIASGFGDGNYKPTQQVNRAQMAVFVSRAFLGMP